MATATRQILSAEDLGAQQPVEVTFLDSDINLVGHVFQFGIEMVSIISEYEGRPIIMNFSGFEHVNREIFRTLVWLMRDRQVSIRLCNVPDVARQTLVECDPTSRLIVASDIVRAVASVTHIV